MALCLHKLFVVALLLLPLAMGCGGSGVRYAPAAGTVTVDGKPIEGAQVVLVYDDLQLKDPQPTSRGTTDSSGRFTLKTLTSEKQLVAGGVVGTHRVRITTRIVEQDELGKDRVVRQELLGEPYTSGAKLTAEITPAGADDLKFDLSSKE